MKKERERAAKKDRNKASNKDRQKERRIKTQT